MGRFKKALGAGFLITFFVMCFYNGFAVLQALFLGTDVVKATLDSIVVGFVVWGFFTFALFEFYGYIEERDARDAAERQARNTPPADRIEPQNSKDTDKK